MSNEQQNHVLHHWRTGSQSDYVGVEILPNGQSIIATISHIVWDENAKVQGSKKPSWIAYFKETNLVPKPMLLNSTNRKRLTKLAQTDYPETIRDFRVILCKELTRDPSDGGKVYGLRIGRDVPPPPQKEKMTVNSDKFKAALEALKSGKCDIGYITASYDVDAEAMKLFNEATKK